MNWKDILKAEIQIIPSATTADSDVNINLEDDDCIRWVRKLVKLFGELPSLDTKYNSVSKEYFREDLLTEEMACEFKKYVNKFNIEYLDYDSVHELLLTERTSPLDNIPQNSHIRFFLDFQDEGSRRIKDSGPIMELNLVFILTSPNGSVVSLERTGDLILDKQEIDSFERQIKKICRHCSWQPTGLNKFFTKFRSNYNNDNVEKTTGGVNTFSPTVISGKLVHTSYGGKKRGKKRQSKKEDY